MDLGLKDKVAFIAASSEGLGKAVAKELVIEGASVVICGRNPETLELAQEEIQSAGNGKVIAVTGDLNKSADRAFMIKAALKEFEAIDILVTNNGGPPTGKFEELKQEQWDLAYQQLLASTTDLVRGFLPSMKKKNWGRIISITSMAVKQPVNNLILSNSIRLSVVGLMKTLANELGAYNITVNNVMPGYTETERLTKLIKTTPSFSSARSEVPMGRFGKPEEFAAAVTFLASERAGYITGISLAVDGGWIKSIL